MELPLCAMAPALASWVEVIAGTAGVYVALILAALLLFCIGWGVAQNQREETAARDAQILLGRHLSDKRNEGR